MWKGSVLKNLYPCLLFRWNKMIMPGGNRPNMQNIPDWTLHISNKSWNFKLLFDIWCLNKMILFAILTSIYKGWLQLKLLVVFTIKAIPSLPPGRVLVVQNCQPFVPKHHVYQDGDAWVRIRGVWYIHLFVFTERYFFFFLILGVKNQLIT